MSDQTIRAATAPDEAPVVRTITRDDVRAALAEGWADFKAMPTHAVFIVIIYPVIGLALARVTSNADLLPLLYPLLAGFALLGPVAALGLYELSRRREQGFEPIASDALAVLHSPARAGIIALTLLLLLTFVVWLFVANWLASALLPDERMASYEQLVREVFSTGRGWALIIIGNLVGFCFALFVFAISAVSFPLMLDRHVDFGTAVSASVAAVRRNPAVMAFWGLIIAGGLALGSLPFFLGLAIVLPVLGHATWRLYRRLIA